MVYARTNKLRTRPEITSAFSISSSGRLWPFLNRQILNVGSLRFRFRLKLEGRSIVRLILRREGDNEREEFRRPEQIIKLPTGKYTVQEVHLDGGYICYASRGPTRRLVTVTSDEPATLKIGGPLKQTVKVNRQGRLLVMNHELLGVDGEQYTNGTSREPPTFTVYRGDKEIASDKFEFG